MGAVRNSCLVAAISMGALAGSPAQASLTLFQQYVGSFGLSTDGFGSTSSSGTISAFVPTGSTVTSAFLYSSLVQGASGPVSGSLNGTAVNFSTALGSQNGLQAYRADVTSTVSAAVNGGPGGVYTFNLTEGNTSIQDGEALVVVYSNPLLSVSTVAILDGFSASSGDRSSISFSSPLNTAAPGFTADLRIGDGYSYSPSGQTSTITVNGQTLTTVAGNYDDGAPANGALITVGGFNDPFTVATPGSPATDYNLDHERYNLTPFITNGSSIINLTTLNPSNDDNIFLQTLLVSGNGTVVTGGVPEPSTWAMMLIGFGGLAYATGRKQNSGTTALRTA